MRRILNIAILLMPVFTGCSGAGLRSGYTIGEDTSAEYEAGQMAARLSPAGAAMALADWMEQAPVDRQEFAARLYAALRDSLTARDREAGDRLDIAIDSVYACLPATGQAKMLVMSASPERVAAVLAEDDTVSLCLHEQVLRLYNDHPELLSRFTRAMR